MRLMNIPWNENVTSQATAQAIIHKVLNNKNKVFQFVCRVFVQQTVDFDENTNAVAGTFQIVELVIIEFIWNSDIDFIRKKSVA